MGLGVQSVHHCHQEVKSKNPSNMPEYRSALTVCTCCQTEIEAADQTCYLPQSQYRDTQQVSPSTGPPRWPSGKVSALRVEDPGFKSRLRRAGIFSGSSHTSDLKMGDPVATLPGAWRYRVSTGTGQPGVSIL